jgi:NAD(P) transhydrogenase subunit alpha
MTTLTPDQALDRARAAADAARIAAEQARLAAEQATAVADQIATVAGAAAHAATGGAIDPTVFRLTIFALAVFVGYYVVWSVTPALHTPLMSVTNAISSVIVVGALLAVGVQVMDSGTLMARIFGFVALVLASINIFGGFLVTQRMLAMYKAKEKPAAKKG